MSTDRSRSRTKERRQRHDHQEDDRHDGGRSQHRGGARLGALVGVAIWVREPTAWMRTRYASTSAMAPKSAAGIVSPTSAPAWRARRASEMFSTIGTPASRAIVRMRSCGGSPGPSPAPPVRPARIAAILEGHRDVRGVDDDDGRLLDGGEHATLRHLALNLADATLDFLAAAFVPTRCSSFSSWRVILSDVSSSASAARRSRRRRRRRS